MLFSVRRAAYAALALAALLIAAAPTAAAQSGRRVALVVGNAAYQKLPRLRNPANDAADMGAALRRLGFDADVVVDGGYQAMMEAAERFRRKLAGADAGLFFYAGHGVQSGGVNYLVPVDAVIDEEYQLQFKAVSADYVLSAMNQSGCPLSIVLLDACRDNPFAASRSLGRGLALSGASPQGAIIAYATDPGKTAADGEGRNGIFTGALLRNIEVPGIDVKELLDRVGADVASATNQAQTPWVSSKFYGKFYLAGGGVDSAAPAVGKADRSAAGQGSRQPGKAAQPPAAAPAAALPAPRDIGSIYVDAAAEVSVRGSGASSFESSGGKSVEGLPAGSYSLEASGPGYETARAKVELRKGEAFRWSPWTSGQLSFKSDPPGARLSIDGRDYGSGPLVARDLIPGVVALSAELEGYGVWRGRAEISAGKTVSVSAAMPPGSYHGEILVSGGRFKMGGQGGGEEEQPLHDVTVSDFYILPREVDQAAWAKIMGSNPSPSKGDQLPVSMVSWRDAATFANGLSALDGLEPCYSISGSKVTCDFSRSGWRLPTEAEWEYAARGGGASRGFPLAGGSDAASVAWYKANAKSYPHPTGQKAPNELGLYDMSGNVWEWCWDWFGSYSFTAQTDPRGPASGTSRVARGGSWSDDPYSLRIARRAFGDPGQGNAIIGFRLVRRR